MPTRSQVVAYARTLIGIGENPPGSNKNIITETFGYVGAWCAMTTWYVWRHFGLDLRREFTPGWAATTLGAAAAQKRGMWHNGLAGIQPGDLVYFKLPDGDPGWVNHTGIVSKVLTGPSGAIVGVNAIEGNTANVLAERTRTAHIVGYIDMSRYVHDRPAPKPGPAPKPVPPFPGREAFRLNRRHVAVTELDRQLIRTGYTRHHDGDGYQAGPKFTEHTRRNVQDFQLAQGWKGKTKGGDADGYPGPETWRLLFAAPTKR